MKLPIARAFCRLADNQKIGLVPEKSSLALDLFEPVIEARWCFRLLEVIVEESNFCKEACELEHKSWVSLIVAMSVLYQLL